ncbi:hypothetical protein [Streptomyces sp. NPDC002088]|uniref:hypothetical protein n=1 Tax=Streptomyces sp. NPDC002088 TaxID=3154665 RepID=UPI0033309176
MPEPRPGPAWERAFSTPGCPDASAAARLVSVSGNTGVDLRCASPEGLLTPRAAAAERNRLAVRLREAGARDLWVASCMRVADTAVSDRQCLAALRGMVELAADLGALGVRVFPGGGSPGDDAVAPRPRLSGTEALPPAGLRAALAAVGYRGCLSLEWEKRWYPQGPPPRRGARACGPLAERAPVAPLPARPSARWSVNA